MHVTEIVNQKQVSDGAVAVTVRCCKNPLTDSVITIYGIGTTTSPEKLLADVDKHHDKVAAKCKGMSAGKIVLTQLTNRTKEHGDI